MDKLKEVLKELLKEKLNDNNIELEEVEIEEIICDMTTIIDTDLNEFINQFK